MSFAVTKHTDAIARAAIELFREHGYESVSITKICTAAGISRTAFYVSFGSKRDVLSYILSTARSSNVLESQAFLEAENDLERIWYLCGNYLEIATRYGPELVGALMRLEMTGDIQQLDIVHDVDSWMIRLCKNCQRDGIIRNQSSCELLAKLGVDLVYQVLYNWSKSKGAFSLRKKARIAVEVMYDIAPEYRMTEKQLAQL